MIVYLLYLLVCCSAYAADPYIAIDFKTPLKQSFLSYTELEHATMMEKMTYQEMRSASQEKERECLQKIRLSTLSTPELQALKEISQTKRAQAQSAWTEKFDECCCQSTCAGGGALSTGMLLGCFSPAIFGLSMGPLKGCFLGGLASTPICVCLVCYYAQAHNAELNEIEEHNRNIDHAIKAKEMAE